MTMKTLIGLAPKLRSLVDFNVEVAPAAHEPAWGVSRDRSVGNFL